MSIGKRIRQYRTEAKLSQKELGKRLGISQQQIAQYETGKRIPKLETIDKIAKALNIDPYSIYSFDMASKTLENDMNKDTIAAHFNGDEYTEAELEEIKRFAEFVKSRREKE